MTVCARLERGATTRGAVTFVGSAADGIGGGRGIDRVEWSRLHDDARAMAGVLQRRGVDAGSHVGVLGSTSRALVTALEAIWLAGGTVVALPLPMRLGSLEEFVAQTGQRIAGADVTLVLVDAEFAEFVDVADHVAVVTLTELVGETRRGARGFRRATDDPDRLAILQFTSGSTAEPKGVMLPDRCIVTNVDAIVEAAAITAEDRAVSWLPLYHDMGLIGLLMTPMLNGFDLVLGAPQDFLASPAVWLEWISEFRGTVTAGPNFSYALAARALPRTSGVDLTSWRLALNGAETVDPAAVEAFCAAGAPYGLDAKAAFPVFGMAEATLAVTFPDLGTGMEVDTVDLGALEAHGEARPVPRSDDNARRFAVLGSPIRDVEIRIVDRTAGEPLASRRVGELQLRGPSVTPGYYRNETATAATFDDGWLCTGDLGYLLDDRLVVCGRLKDMIIIGGRNVFPEDVERAAAGVDGVRAGNVIAFGSNRRRGREAIVVVAETRADDPGTVRDRVVSRVTDAVGIPPVDVVLVSPGSLPKTSSGKLQRSLCRDRYHVDALEPV